MPRGIPSTPPTPPTDRKLTITLHEQDYAALVELAVEQYRTPELQAAWLLAKVFSEAGRTTTVDAAGRQAARAADHAERILARAREAQSGAA